MDARNPKPICPVNFFDAGGIMNHVMIKTVFRVVRPDSNQSAQLHKLVRVLKLWV